MRNVGAHLELYRDPSHTLLQCCWYLGCGHPSHALLQRCWYLKGCGHQGHV